MAGAWASVTRRIESVKGWGRRRLALYRVRWAWFDHLLRTVHRYQAQRGDRLAGAVTYFAFLSFFPLLALAFSVFGYVIAFREGARRTLIAALNQQLPGLAGSLRVDQLADARVEAGLIGLVGLLYAGLGALDALREAMRDMTMTSEPPVSMIIGRLRDLVALLLVGVTLMLSVLAGGFAVSATGTVLGWFGLGPSVVGTVLVRVAALVIALLADTLVFLVILGWLGRLTGSRRALLKGALLGAVGFGVLKQLANLLLSGTLNNPIYGTFAVVVGLLVWINLSARWTMYVTAWTATAGGSPPPAPSPAPATAYT
ncbi:inner membrane protein YhjD [Sphaerisporangium rubeum]|uniref:Membrane protein n=1 Tax=Sphaerisporangium rubeum TaxID=321317 RepID=A0A7X0M578_9ACTN|nr:YihY/virulence factor BrkB family protein [Sphaerisporangium rubeum]MBB6471932.1 membrane protein [Sphaerisporangium rubeum]